VIYDLDRVANGSASMRVARISRRPVSAAFSPPPTASV
jgi:hypothetical protein